MLFGGAEPRKHVAALLGGLAVASVLDVALAYPVWNWKLAEGARDYPDSIPAPPGFSLLIWCFAAQGAVAVVFGLAALVPSLPRRIRVAGLGVLLGWALVTAVSGGWLTGLQPRLYEPAQDADSWANITTATPAAELRTQIQATLDRAIGLVPEPMSYKSDVHDWGGGVYGASAVAHPLSGGTDALQRTWARALARLYKRVGSTHEGRTDARFKVSPDICVDVADLGPDGVRVTVRTPHIRDLAH
ncbi:hypothetical protein [Actinomadura rupiterrae]|uniref:hypothetical protein n=1 Tax=Actinomadura rupiterrae TaxID=559627 RepID=UPI0020A38482|nr:hypothetical protein [Actinomadura rupiterrae]MCP2335461.1 hypothetical protein [Actinomadura rupiterrae]